MSEEEAFPTQRDVDQLRKKTKWVRLLTVEQEQEISDQLLFEYLDKGDRALSDLPPPPEKIIAETGEAVDLSQLFDCLELVEGGTSGWICPLVGSLYLECHPTKDRLMIYDSIIRWENKWTGDARLENPKKLAVWLANHGIQGP